MAEVIPVGLRQTGSGWQLLRGGEPYFILGAGGPHSPADLAAAGGNSIRTWDTENVRGDEDVGVLLDEAQALGLTVTVGIWLGHERHGFDYADAGQLRTQFDRARDIVERFRHHPALLLWGIGNEMEGFDDGDDPAVWRAVNDIAAMVKEVDPCHPTMTVTTFVHGERVEFVHRHCDAIDIHGFNAYGGAPDAHRWLRERGATKPFVLAEFGPLGPWESPTTGWGAPLEQTSTQKADFYRDTYRVGIEAQRDLALGSYAFLWGNKMEATPTWFGMWLDDGARLGAVDAMSEVWSGKRPDDPVPEVEPLVVDGPSKVGPGATLAVRAAAEHPEGRKLRARWELRHDTDDILTGGDFRPCPPRVEGAVVSSNVGGATLVMPETAGRYRLYFTVYDDAGGAATANVPLLVEGE